MDITNLLFIALSLVTLVCAIMVVISRNPIHSILYMILTMFSLSGHYILLHAQFIGVVNIIVYAGAIMVLFLFVLMLLNLNKSNEPQKSLLWKFFGLFLGLAALTIAVLRYQIRLTTQSMSGVPLPNEFGYVKPLGKALFTNYVFPFEISSILFIAAMVGVVFLGSKRDPSSPSERMES